MVKLPKGYGRTTSGKIVKIKKLASDPKGTEGKMHGQKMLADDKDLEKLVNRNPKPKPKAKPRPKPKMKKAGGYSKLEKKVIRGRRKAMGSRAYRDALPKTPKKTDLRTGLGNLKKQVKKTSKAVKSSGQTMHKNMRSTLRAVKIKRYQKAKPLASIKGMTSKALVKGKYLGQKAAVKGIMKGKRVLRNPGGKAAGKLVGGVALAAGAVAAASNPKVRKAAKYAGKYYAGKAKKAAKSVAKTVRKYTRRKK